MSFSQEIYRKIFHLIMLIFPISYFYLGKWNFLLIVAPIAAAMFAIDYYRHKNEKIKFYFEKFFNKLLRDKEKEIGNLCGATYTMLAVCLIFLICKAEIAITAFVILAICDASASLVGKAIPSKPFFEKSFAGSCAFYLSGIVVIFFCGAIFDSHFWFYLFGFFALFCTTIIEARPSFFKIDDNFSIPVSYAFIMTVFDLMWNYSY